MKATTQANVPGAGLSAWPPGHNPISTESMIRCTCGGWESHPFTRTSKARWDAFDDHCSDIKLLRKNLN